MSNNFEKKYTYVCRGTATIKTPHVDKFSDIKIETSQTAERIKIHEEFPNGLIFDMYQYPDKIEYITNKRIIADDDLTLKFED